MVLYWCEIWPLILREEHRLRVFQSSLLKRIFGPRRNDVTYSWRKLHDKGLHNLFLRQAQLE
jgi:hypothetical protein